MRPRFSVSAVVALAICAAMPTGVAGVSAKAASDQAVLRRASGCVFRRDGGAARRLVGAIPGSPEESSAEREIARSVELCLAGVGLTVTPRRTAIITGSIAQRYYLDKVDRYRSYVSGETNPSSRPRWVLERTSTWPKADAALNCIVERDSNAADRVLRTAVGSRDEASAIAEAIALLPLCIEAGATLALDRSLLRAGLARAMYRYVVVNLRP